MLLCGVVSKLKRFFEGKITNVPKIFLICSSQAMSIRKKKWINDLGCNMKDDSDNIETGDGDVGEENYDPVHQVGSIN